MFRMRMAHVLRVHGDRGRFQGERRTNRGISEQTEEEDRLQRKRR